MNLLTVANGFYVGARRSARRVDELRKGWVSKVCACQQPNRPGSDEMSHRDARCRRCTDRLGCMFGTVQTVFAVVGTMVMWAVIILAYVGTIAFLFLYVLVELFRLYCERLRPYTGIALNFTAASILEANETLALAIATTSTAEESFAAMEQQATSTTATFDNSINTMNDALPFGQSTYGKPSVADNTRMLFVLSPIPTLLAWVRTDQIPIRADLGLWKISDDLLMADSRPADDSDRAAFDEPLTLPRCGPSASRLPSPPPPFSPSCDKRCPSTTSPHPALALDADL